MKIHLSWSRTMETSGLGIFSLLVCVGILCSLGGAYSCLAAVKISEKKLGEETFKTAIKKVYSLEACRVSESRVLISVGGLNPTYSGFLSDVLELKSEKEESETQKKIKCQEDQKQKSQTQESQIEIQTQTDLPITFPSSPTSPNQNYSEKVLVDFMSKVLVYIQALFHDFTKKCQPRVIVD